MDEIIDVLTDVLSGQAQQTTSATVTMLMECVASAEQAPAETRV